VARGFSRDVPSEVSDMPLDGYITSMHLARNDRTSEDLLIGGSDDGSIAIWSLRSACIVHLSSYH
jgi:WD repeat-containing protein 7